MSFHDDCIETREQEVDNALGYIDHLTAREARSVLRWILTNDEEFSPYMLTEIANTVRMTLLNTENSSNHGINTLLDFSNTSSAKFQWEQSQRSQQARADEEVSDKARNIKDPTTSLINLR